MYKVGVIGLGHIAAMYETPDSKTPYCHVGGIRYSDRVKLTAVADMDAAACDRFRGVWGAAFPEDLKYYGSGRAMLEAAQLDIVAVCVRGPHHFKVMMEVLEARPKAIFLEKPPSCSLTEMDEMVSAAKEKKIPVTVSYSRHWSPKVLAVAEMVRQGAIGKVKTVVGYTGHSVLSFGIHTTDLICQFAGYCPEAVYARGTVGSDPVPEGYEVEPGLDSMIVEFSNGIRGIQIGPDGEHGGFYCDVLGSEGYARAGIYTAPVILNKKGEPVPFDVPQEKSVFTVAYDQIAGYLDGGPLPDCTDGHFIAVNEIGFAAIESILTGNRIALPNANRSRKVFANG